MTPSSACGQLLRFARCDASDASCRAARLRENRGLPAGCSGGLLHLGRAFCGHGRAVQLRRSFRRRPCCARASAEDRLLRATSESVQVDVKNSASKEASRFKRAVGMQFRGRLRSGVLLQSSQRILHRRCVVWYYAKAVLSWSETKAPEKEKPT